MFRTNSSDVTTRAYVYDLTGKLENEIVLPGPGTAGGFGGNHDDVHVFYTYTSFNAPPTIYRYDIATRASSVSASTCVFMSIASSCQQPDYPA